MKLTRIGTCILVGVLATSILAFSGCSSSQSSNSESSTNSSSVEETTSESEALTEAPTEATTEAAKSPIAGTYSLVSTRYGSAEVAISGMELIIDNDNNGIEKTSYATNRKMVFNLETGTVTFDNSAESDPFTYDDSTLTITTDGVDYIYKKNQ